MQANIVALRQERHRLANVAMRSVALEHKLAAVTEELNRLRMKPREKIEIAMDASESIVVTPSAIEPRFRSGRRR